MIVRVGVQRLGMITSGWSAQAASVCLPLDEAEAFALMGVEPVQVHVHVEELDGF